MEKVPHWTNITLGWRRSHTGPTSHWAGEGTTLDQHHTGLEKVSHWTNITLGMEKVPHWTNITLGWRRSHTEPTSHWVGEGLTLDQHHTGHGEGLTLDQHHTGLEKVSHWTNITLGWRRDHTGPTSHWVGEGLTLD